MKVTGETFSFHNKRKGAEGARYQKYPNFQAKGLLPDRTLESFIQKSTEGATPNFQRKTYCLIHSIPGDLPLLSIEEVKSLAGGAGSGRVQR